MTHLTSKMSFIPGFKNKKKNIDDLKNIIIILSHRIYPEYQKINYIMQIPCSNAGVGPFIATDTERAGKLR